MSTLEIISWILAGCTIIIVSLFAYYFRKRKHEKFRNSLILITISISVIVITWIDPNDDIGPGTIMASIFFFGWGIKILLDHKKEMRLQT